MPLSSVHSPLHRASLLLLALVRAVSSFSPSEDLLCFYNGAFNTTTSTCSCFPGWLAPDCRFLDLQPAAPLSSANQTYYHPADVAGVWHDNSWGMSALPGDGDGLWHGFMTELQANCSLAEYGTASRILHMTSASLLGPWTISDVALSAFAHNPNVVRDVDGAWLLFHIGAPLTDCSVSCASGKPVTNGTCGATNHGTSVARAMSPYGPWTRLSYILPDNQTNPSAVVMSDGTIVVTARRWTGDVPLYTSTTGWMGPYTRVLAPLAQYPPDASSMPETGNTTWFDEDPFLWVDAGTGYAHMVTHRQPSGTSCSATGPTPDDCRCAGGHLFAPTLQGPWYVDPVSLFNCTLSVASVNGTTQLQLHARQRPTLAWNASTGCPMLFTGASTDPTSQYYSSFTMAQAVNC